MVYGRCCGFKTREVIEKFELTRRNFSLIELHSFFNTIENKKNIPLERDIFIKYFFDYLLKIFTDFSPSADSAVTI